MRQYDVYPNPSLRSRGARPYVVVLQHHLAGELPTVLVAPLARSATEVRARRLTPLFDFAGERFALLLPSMAAIEASRLRAAVGDLDAHHDVIRPAIDLLFNGA